MSLLFAMLLVSGQAAAPQATTAPAAPTKKLVERKICKTEDAESGSHMSKRVCYTQREWELVAQGVNLGDKTVQTQMPEQH